MIGKTYRFRFFLACILNIQQQLSGINFLIFFSTQLFNDISGNGPVMTMVIGASNVLGAIVGIFTISKFGRRCNMMAGSLMQAVAFGMLLIGMSNNILIILYPAVVIYMIFFAMGNGGTVPVFCAEIIPPTGIGLTNALQWMFASLVGKLVPLAMPVFGPKGLILFFIICCIIEFLTQMFLCVETKVLNEDQIVSAYSNGISGVRRYMGSSKKGYSE